MSEQCQQVKPMKPGKLTEEERDKIYKEVAAEREAKMKEWFNDHDDPKAIAPDLANPDGQSNSRPQP